MYSAYRPHTLLISDIDPLKGKKIIEEDMDPQ
jgi:hypothetical protein